MRKLLLIAALIGIALTGCKKDNKEPVKPVEYTVTFDAAGGAPVPQKQTVEAGKTATAPASSPTKAGYVFMFWSLSGSTTAYNFQTTVNGNITLVAQWQSEATVEYWQVSWNLNGGAWTAGYTPPAQVVKGGTLAEPTPPTKAGNTLEGWYKEAALTNKVNFPYDVSGVAANITLYAKWEGIAAAAQLEVLFSFNSNVTPVTATFSKDWFDVGGGKWTGFFIVRTNQPAWKATSNQTWCTLEEFTNVGGEDGFYISFEPNTTDLIREATITVTAANATPVTFSIPQKGGIHGLGLYMGTWRLTGNDGYWSQIIISADKVVYMDNDGYNFIMEELTWTATVNPVSSDYYSNGYKVTGKLTSTNNYSIPSASGSGNAAVGGNALVTFYIGANKDYIAMGNFQTAQQEALYGPYNWKVDAEYWQVTWNLDGGSWQSNPNQLTMVAKDGKLAEPKAPTKSGVYFTGWLRNGSSISFPYNVSSITGDFTLTAKWGAPATLNVTVQAGVGYYSSITAMAVSGGAVNTTIPSGVGTHTVSVPPGTYRIFRTYWSCSDVSCMSSGYSSNFTVSSGQTRNITILNGAVGF